MDMINQYNLSRPWLHNFGLTELIKTVILNTKGKHIEFQQKISNINISCKILNFKYICSAQRVITYLSIYLTNKSGINLLANFS
jgi:hypothetical protein